MSSSWEEPMLKDDLQTFIKSIIFHNPHNNKDAFYVLDLGTVASLMDRWNRNFPTIRPFYAVKCNTNLQLLKAMVSLGAGFDCASRAEIETILSMGVSPDRIIYANPCKTKSHIKYAAAVGVNLTTFDSVHEIEKIRTNHPNCELLVRIRSPESGEARLPMCEKYGALQGEFETLLRAAQDANVRVTGVSFHIGSAASNPHAYRSVVALARNLFDTALRLDMEPMHLLNIGGGFNAGSMFEEMASVIKLAIDKYFDNVPNLEVIAEPGRYFAETAGTLVASVIGKRVRGDLREYWIGDGVFGSFNCVMNDRSRFLDMVPLACASSPTDLTFRSTIFGPTCAGSDVVATDRQLPELDVDDWLVFPKMGAYDASLGTNFNGFKIDAITVHIMNPCST